MAGKFYPNVQNPRARPDMARAIMKTEGHVEEARLRRKRDRSPTNRFFQEHIAAKNDPAKGYDPAKRDTGLPAGKSYHKKNDDSVEVKRDPRFPTTPRPATPDRPPENAWKGKLRLAPRGPI